MPTLSIAVLSYNRQPYIREMISSILTQTWSDFELTVWDNASTDATVDDLRRVEDVRLKIHVQPRNIGVVANMNMAIDQCQTDYLLITHDDDRMKSTLVAHYMRLVEGKNDISLVCCNADQIDENGDLIVSSFVRKNYPAFKEPANGIGGFARDYVQGLNYIVCPTVMLNVKTVKAAGLRFREHVGPATDSFFWCELSYQPGRYVFLEESLYEYRIHRRQDSNLRSRESISGLRRPLYGLLAANDPILAQKWWETSLRPVWGEWLGRSRSRQEGSWKRLWNVIQKADLHDALTRKEKLNLLTATWKDSVDRKVFKAKMKFLSAIRKGMRRIQRLWK